MLSDLQPTPVQIEQAPDALHPTHRPALQLGPSLGQGEKVAAHVGPVKGQFQTLPLSGQLLVYDVAVAQQDAGRILCEVRLRHRGRTAGGQGEQHRRRGSEHPKMPALTRLALHLHEHSPAGLVRLPTILAQLPAADSLPHRLQQREQLPESSRDRPRRQPQTLLRQLLQQSVTGTRIKVLVQDHLHPHRNAQLAACDQTGWGGRRHEARQDPASTAGTVSPASDHPTPDPGLDLHHLGVIGPRKRIQGPAAAGTLLLRFGQIRHFLPGFQPLQAASPMSPTPRLLSPRARPGPGPATDSCPRQPYARFDGRTDGLPTHESEPATLHCRS